MIDTTTIRAQEAQQVLLNLISAASSQAALTANLDRTLTPEQRLLLKAFVDVAAKTQTAFGEAQR